VKTQSEIALAKVKADLDAKLSVLDAHPKAATEAARTSRSYPPGARKARDGHHYVADMRQQLRGMWARNLEVARANGLTLTPEEFALMVVYENYSTRLTKVDEKTGATCDASIAAGPEITAQVRAQIDAASAAHQVQLQVQKAPNEAIDFQLKTQARSRSPRSRPISRGFTEASDENSQSPQTVERRGPVTQRELQRS
jgi:hypothetical protein